MGRGSPLSDDNDDDTVYESSPPSSEAFWSPFGPDATADDSGEFHLFVTFAGNLVFVYAAVGGWRKSRVFVRFASCFSYL